MTKNTSNGLQQYIQGIQNQAIRLQLILAGACVSALLAAVVLPSAVHAMPSAVIEFNHPGHASTNEVGQPVIAGYAQITIAGTIDVDTDIQVDLVGGSAIWNTDYELDDPVTVTLPAGTYTGLEEQGIPVPKITLLPDDLVEGDETVLYEILESSLPTGITKGDANDDGTDQQDYTFTIGDDDTIEAGPISADIEFSKDGDQSVGEVGKPVIAGFVKILVGEATIDEDFVVEVAITGGTAGPSEYKWSSPMQITIPAGDYDGTDATGVPVTKIDMVDDEDIDGDKTIEFEFVTETLPEGVVLADVDGDESVRTLYTYTASDDDDPVGDNDKDGVSNGDERGGPNNGDANGDTIPDFTQPNVGSTTTPTGDPIVLEVGLSGGCTTLSAFSTVAEKSLTEDPDYDYPVGLQDYTVQCSSAGSSAIVTIYFDTVYDTSEWVWRKYNSTTKTYDTITGVTYGTSNIGGTPVTTATYTVVDGSAQDEDGTTNSQITDPSGPAFAVLAAVDGAEPEELAQTGVSAVMTSMIGVVLAGAAVSVRSKQTSRDV